MPLAYDPDKRIMYSLAPDGQWAETQMAIDAKAGKRYGLDRGQWIEVPDEEVTWGRTIDNAVRAIARGATFGWADEFAAKMDQVTGRSGRDSYEKNVAEERLRDAQAKRQNPIMSTIGEVGGAVAGTIAGGGVARAIPGVASVGQAIGSVIPKTMQYAGIGAGAGALAGAGESEEGERLQGAIPGAVIGGAAGAVIPPVVNLAGRGLSAAGRAIGDRLAPEGAATRKLVEAVARDDMTPERIARRLEMLGPHGTIADAGGPNVRGMAEAVANEPGVGQRMATRVMGARSATQGARITEAAREGLGAQGRFYEQIDDLMRERAAAAAPLYDQAHAVGPIFSEGLAKLSERPSLRAALPRAVRIAAEEGVTPSELVGLAVEQGGAVRLVQPAAGAMAREGTAAVTGPTMRTWDFVKRGLDDVIEKYRDSVTGRLRLDTEGRAINETRAALVRELDRLNPAYAEARAAWAGPTQAIEAMTKGRAFARGDEEVTAKIVKGMTPSDREFFREGVMREIQTLIDRGADGINKARQFVAVPRMRAALEEAFPDRESFRGFMQTLIGENRMALTKNAVLGGSPTARRLAGQSDLGADTRGIATEAALGNTTGVLRAAYNWVVNQFGKMPQEQKDSLARMLFSTDPAAQQEALRRMGGTAQMLGARRVQAELARLGLAGAVGEESGALSARVADEWR